MYYKDKSRSVTVRLSAEQYAFLEKSAQLLEVTPSHFLRMVVNATMQGSAMVDNAAKEVFHDEHKQAVFDDQLQQPEVSSSRS